MIELTNNEIDYTALTESVRSHQSGAVILFLGTVREMTAGRQTVALDYQAYPEMAQAKLAEIEQTAREKWPVEGLGGHRPPPRPFGIGRYQRRRGCQLSAPPRRIRSRQMDDRHPQRNCSHLEKRKLERRGATEWVHPGAETADNQSPPT